MPQYLPSVCWDSREQGLGRWEPGLLSNPRECQSHISYTWQGHRCRRNRWSPKPEGHGVARRCWPAGRYVQGVLGLGWG